MTTSSTERQPRTELERQIRQRHLTYEEFAAYAETFAREHDEAGTLSSRHLQRLTAGRQRVVRPATARLLERILGRSIAELLAPPADNRPAGSPQPLRVAIAVVTKDNDVLLVRRRTDHYGLTWQFPAGIIKPGENPETVATRETLNETGIHCAITRYLGNRIHPVTGVHCEYLLCSHLAGIPKNIDTVENSAITWVGRQTVGAFVLVENIAEPVRAVLDVWLDDET